MSVGDFVLIRINDNNLSLNECEVVRVDELYHDYDNKTDPHRAVVTWFCRPSFLPPALRAAGHGLEEQGAPPLDPEHEVVGEARDYDKDIEAESIYYKCRVVQGGLGEVPAKVAKAKKEGKFPCYLHRLDMKLQRKTGKKMYRLEPLFGRGCGSTPARRVLGENLQQVTSPGLRSTVTNLVSGSPRQSRRSVGRVMDEVRGSPSPTGELSSFVTNTVVGSFDSPRSGEKGLDGGYWGALLEGKRTPVGRVREKLVETETATNSGRKVKIKYGTEMETATESGRKVTLKGPKKPLTLVKTPEKKKHSAVVKKSSGLTPDKITSLLDSDAEMEEEEKKPTKPKVTRKRRASVSCTTPPKLSTPVKAKRKASSRPASEVKPKANRRRSSFAKAKSEEETAESDDDDFIPKPKLRKAPPKVVARKVESSEEPSEESEDEEEESGNESEDEPSPKKRRKVVSKSTKEKSLTKPAAARQPMKRKSFQPKMAPRPKPLSKAVNSMTEAQQRLHVSAVPESLPCREDEFAEVGI